MNNLYIYGGEKEINIASDDNDYLYHINIGKIRGFGSTIDDIKKVSAIAIAIRDSYVKFIDDLNYLFLNEGLVYDNNISSFFFTDLFNKRTEFFDTYNAICHVKYLTDIASNEIEIENIYLIECSNMFTESISSVCPSKVIIFGKAHRKANSSLYDCHYSQLRYFFNSFFQLLIIKNLYGKQSLNNISERLFLTRFPLCFNKNFQEIKYVNMVSAKDKYLISIITDGLHQNIRFKECFKIIKSLNKKKGNIILLDNFVKQTDVIKSIILHFQLSMKMKKLIKKKYNYNGIDISKYIQKELIQSFLRLPRLFMYKNALINIFSKIKINQFIFYLHEYSYGRFFNYIIAKYFPSIERIGFQHGPIARRKLLYFINKNSISNDKKDWLIKTPIPNKVIAEDKYSRNVYKEAGFNNIKIMNKIHRLYYLDDMRKVEKSNQILIVGGKIDGPALLKKVIDIVRSNPSKHYLFKPHPKSAKLKDIILQYEGINNLEFVFGHIMEYLHLVKEVIATYSSVGYEAYLLGIKVNLVHLPNKINESPLLDIYESGEKQMIKNIW